MLRQQPVHDRLAVAHVIFFELRAFADAPQLHQRVARVGFVLGLHDRLLLVGRHQADRRQVRIGHEVQRHQIGARLLERRVLLLQQILRRHRDVIGHAARAVAEHLVNLGGQLARQTRPTAWRAPTSASSQAELLAEAVGHASARRRRARSTATPTCCRTSRGCADRSAG